MDPSDVIPEYCRQIETYLCKKNDGHLIRVVGQSFVLVAGWAERAIPIKVAFAGIDRYFERYYRSGPRRRPVKIDFCDADVQDVFDEWRRATGVTRDARLSTESSADARPSAGGSRQSLPEHLERVVMRLTSGRASGTLDDRFDPVIDRASAELDAARAKSGGVRGEARQRMIERLSEIDRDMLALARERVGDSELRRLSDEAAADLAGFKAGMPQDSYAFSRDRAGHEDDLSLVPREHAAAGHRLVDGNDDL